LLWPPLPADTQRTCEWLAHGFDDRAIRFLRSAPASFRSAPTCAARRWPAILVGRHEHRRPASTWCVLGVAVGGLFKSLVGSHERRLHKGKGLGRDDAGQVRGWVKPIMRVKHAGPTL